MTPPPQSFDPVTAAITVLATFAGPVLSQYLGAYAVIILAACIGGCWALQRRETRLGRAGAAAFLALVAGTAVFITAGLAELVNHYVKPGLGNWLLAPIALGIGAVGHDWPAVIKWAVDAVIKWRGGNGR